MRTDRWFGLVCVLQHYPKANITMLSNSKTQKLHIDMKAEEKGFGNITVRRALSLYSFFLRRLILWWEYGWVGHHRRRQLLPVFAGEEVPQDHVDRDGESLSSRRVCSCLHAPSSSLAQELTLIYVPSAPV